MDGVMCRQHITPSIVSSHRTPKRRARFWATFRDRPLLQLVVLYQRDFLLIICMGDMHCRCRQKVEAIRAMGKEIRGLSTPVIVGIVIN